MTKLQRYNMDPRGDDDGEWVDAYEAAKAIERRDEIIAAMVARCGCDRDGGCDACAEARKCKCCLCKRADKEVPR